MKIAVMADGPVGLASVDLLASEAAEALVAVILTEQGAYADRIRAAVPRGVPVLVWGKHEELTAFAPDLLLLAWWPHLLRDKDLALAPTILNMHPSLLPWGRGKDPNFWALVDEQPFGVTIHHVDKSVDGGAIAFQSPIETDWESTAEDLYRAAEGAMIDLLRASLPAIASGNVPRIPQDRSEGSFHRRSDLEPASVIDLDRPTTARQLLNRLRARTFPPHPACRFSDAGDTFEVRVSIRRL